MMTSGDEQNPLKYLVNLESIWIIQATFLSDYYKPFSSITQQMRQNRMRKGKRAELSGSRI